ncbi:Phosphate-selective porin O and P [Nannocystis exedens]|uniref:Phosphate-selective porin O and P n=1 Tax=Nannocystis exedens TaxID=54 RepID=A0A1I2DT45_9BACT|nr:porin [Nannocystis exedens]PCC68918.1 Phosphate-selective porin O and P [Nannocystis exedens]SFE83686.1 Phosphate-selective porin O and P [Nannocystis exedens]
MTAPHPRPLSWLGALVLALPHVASAAPSVSIEIEDDDDAPAPTSSPATQPPRPTTPTTSTAPTTPTTANKTSPAISSPPTAANKPPASTTSPAPPDVDAVPVDAPGVESQPSAPAQPDPEIALLREQLAAVQTRLETVEKARAAEKAEQHQAKQRTPFVRVGDVGRAEIAPTHVGFGPGAGVSQWGVRVSGYIQSQYQWSQLSEDQIQQGGATLNQNRFMVRRGRLRVSGDWKWVAFDFELDGSTTRGPFVGVRQANASFVWRNPDAARPPYWMVTAGLTEAPFGHELRLGQREMMFMERSLGSLAFFPGPVDVGVRVRGGVAAFRYDLAVMNGAPLDDRAGARNTTDPTRAPDYLGRFGFAARPGEHAVSGGVSLLYGTGFHRGSEATKNRLEWSDLNENGAIDTGELVAVPGQAATPSVNFRRWAVGADFQVGLRSKAGWTQILAEGTIASNLDRDLIVADPVVVGADLRELHGYVAVIQELFGRAVVGARYDYYDPNTDLLDRRRGEFVPRAAAIHTISPIAGALLPPNWIPGVRGRLVFQYDAVLDALGRDSRGVPADLKNDQFIVRLQGEF